MQCSTPSKYFIFAIQIYKLAHTLKQPVGYVTTVYGPGLVLQCQYQIKLKSFILLALPRTRLSLTYKIIQHGWFKTNAAEFEKYVLMTTCALLSHFVILYRKP